MMSSQEQRDNFWGYLIREKGQRPRGVTLKRLEKIKAEIMADDDFWFQVIDRFGGTDFFQGDLFYRRYADARSDQSRSNFWAMIRERLNRKEF
jgi:hypothetical protein